MKTSRELVDGTTGNAGRARGLAILGVLAFLTFSALFAPARLLAPVVAGIPGVSLGATAGTLWTGSGRLRLGGRDRGLITWSFRPITLLKLFPGYAWTLSGEHLELGGTMNLAPGRAALSITGSVDAAPINAWLADYELFLGGDFRLRNLYLHITDNRPDDARGTVGWSGGSVRYLLSQRRRTVELPALEAQLRFADGLAATVFAAGNSTPLLEAELLDSGFVRIGITKLMTKMLNDPWPGGGPDHEVVLAVEEKIL